VAERNNGKFDAAIAVLAICILLWLLGRLL